MALPVTPVVRPKVLSGTTNGRLPASILVDTPGQAGGYTVRLVAPAARAWRALCAAAAKAGHILKASGPLDSYRPYERQEQEFRERFVTWNTGTGITRTWNGVKYWLKQGVALAAVPGTSNHGWGLAVDTGEERDGDPGPESLDAATLAWLVANEHRYGWSHEVQSEPWHIRYVTGDAIPAAVLAYESTLENDMAIKDDEDAWVLAHRVFAILGNLPALVGSVKAGERNELHFVLQGLSDRLAKLEAKPGSVDEDRIAVKVADLLAARIKD